jgi:hypothetical protein
MPKTWICNVCNPGNRNSTFNLRELQSPSTECQLCRFLHDIIAGYYPQLLDPSQHAPHAEVNVDWSMNVTLPGDINYWPMEIKSSPYLGIDLELFDPEGKSVTDSRYNELFRPLILYSSMVLWSISSPQTQTWRSHQR